MRIELQETHSAHTTWPTWGDDPIVCSSHNNLRTAVQALLQHEHAMHQDCGKDCWSHNHKLFWADGSEVDMASVMYEIAIQENEAHEREWEREQRRRVETGA